MAGYFHLPVTSEDDQSSSQHNQQYYTAPADPSFQRYPLEMTQPAMPFITQRQGFHQDASQLNQNMALYTHGYQYSPESLAVHQQQALQQQHWAQPVVPSSSDFTQQQPSNAMVAFPPYTEAISYQTHDISDHATALPSGLTSPYLSPGYTPQSRGSRSTSMNSGTSSAAYSQATSDATSRPTSRSVSPSADEMARWGFRAANGNGWTCAYPGCTSQSIFHRGCDLRKHYKRHTKTLFCRHSGCPQANGPGFSSKKDRMRHEQKHDRMLFQTNGMETMHLKLTHIYSEDKMRS